VDTIEFSIGAGLFKILLDLHAPDSFLLHSLISVLKSRLFQFYLTGAFECRFRSGHGDLLGSLKVDLEAIQEFSGCFRVQPVFVSIYADDVDIVLD